MDAYAYYTGLRNKHVYYIIDNLQYVKWILNCKLFINSNFELDNRENYFWFNIELDNRGNSCSIFKNEKVKISVYIACIILYSILVLNKIYYIPTSNYTFF